jgi:tyrosyl-tRNA synthetase
MSVSDVLMWRYIELLSFESLDTISKWKRETAAGGNPRDIKVRFAKEIVARFHDARAADAALEDFESRFRDGAIPQDLPEQVIEVPAEGAPIAQILKSGGLCQSRSEALRMIEQGGVRVNGDKVSDRDLKLAAGSTYVLQVGKRKFAKVALKKAG